MSAATPDAYRLYYWPSIPGRGEYVRLVFEAAGVDYVDVGRLSEDEGGGAGAVAAMMKTTDGLPPFAPPIVVHGELIVAQTAVICAWLGERHGLAPDDEAGRLHARQIQLTIADFVSEVHDTHHPVATGLYYEDQKPEAKRRARAFREQRLPKFCRWFDHLLERSDGAWLLGGAVSYPDLSLWHTVRGLAYAFPNAWAAAQGDYPQLVAHQRRVAELPAIAAYVGSDRRLAFNEDGIFRHYPELDTPV